MNGRILIEFGVDCGQMDICVEPRRLYLQVGL